MQGRVDYEERRAARIERLRARAEKLNAEGRLSLASAQRISAMIPFGQPILVGHHSEKRHRKDLSRIRDGFDRGYKALNEAKKLESRATASERNETISSDDPDAIAKLSEKKNRLEKDLDDAKKINVCVRKCKGDTAKLAELLKAQGFEHSERVCAALLKPDFAGRTGFPAYHLTNLRSELRRISIRIEMLELEAARPKAEPRSFGDITLTEEDNRVQLRFPGKPSEKCRDALKARGFRWAPSTGAWQRQATPAARHIAIELAMAWTQTWEAP